MKYGASQYCQLSWNGTKTDLKVCSYNGRIYFEGDSDPFLSNSEKEYFLKVRDKELLDKILNFLEVIDG